MSIKEQLEQIKKKCEFDEQESWRRCGYDDEREPGIKQIIGGARGENMTLKPVIYSLLETLELQQEALEFYGNENNWKCSDWDIDKMRNRKDMELIICDDAEYNYFVAGNIARETQDKVLEKLKEVSK